MYFLLILFFRPCNSLFGSFLTFITKERHNSKLDDKEKLAMCFGGMLGFRVTFIP
jgi:hypothetical protein